MRPCTPSGAVPRTLEGAEEALDDAVGLGLGDEGETGGDAPEPDLLLEMLGHEVGAVVVAQREAAGGVGAEFAELLADRHADGLGGFEAGADLADVPAEEFGVPVIDDAEQPDLAILHGDDLGVSRPEELHLRPLSEPDVNLSAHPAPIIQPTTDTPATNERTHPAAFAPSA